MEEAEDVNCQIKELLKCPWLNSQCPPSSHCALRKTASRTKDALGQDKAGGSGSLCLSLWQSSVCIDPTP